jgi:hypothetical protein
MRIVMQIPFFKMEHADSAVRGGKPSRHSGHPSSSRS